jgi:hypothetical protein
MRNDGGKLLVLNKRYKPQLPRITVETPTTPLKWLQVTKLGRMRKEEWEGEGREVESMMSDAEW